jgi:chromosome segregation ATPase
MEDLVSQMRKLEQHLRVTDQKIAELERAKQTAQKSLEMFSQEKDKIGARLKELDVLASKISAEKNALSAKLREIQSKSSQVTQNLRLVEGQLKTLYLERRKAEEEMQKIRKTYHFK